MWHGHEFYSDIVTFKDVVWSCCLDFCRSLTHLTPVTSHTYTNTNLSKWTRFNLALPQINLNHALHTGFAILQVVSKDGGQLPQDVMSVGTSLSLAMPRWILLNCWLKTGNKLMTFLSWVFLPNPGNWKHRWNAVIIQESGTVGIKNEAHTNTPSKDCKWKWFEYDDNPISLCQSLPRMLSHCWTKVSLSGYSCGRSLATCWFEPPPEAP